MRYAAGFLFLLLPLALFVGVLYVLPDLGWPAIVALVIGFLGLVSWVLKED